MRKFFMAVFTVASPLLSACLPGIQANKQVLGAHYPSEGIQIFSMGQSRLHVNDEERLYVHVRLALQNLRTTTMSVDPREQRLRPQGLAAVSPEFAEVAGKPGILLVPPGRTGAIDLFFHVRPQTESAIFQWQARGVGDALIGDSLPLQGIGAGVATPAFVVWLPEIQDSTRYEISAMVDWARPDQRWYWWSQDTFCSWMAQPEASDPQRPILWFGDSSWAFDADAESTFESRGTADSSTRRGGWKIRRASPSSVIQSADNSPSTNSGEKATTTRASGTSGSDVARAWREGR